MKMKIKFAELEKMSYEVGRKTLTNAGYVQSRSEVDGSINDEYYTLFDDEGNELHVVSWVTYIKDVPGDEPEYIEQEKWHWSEASGGWGGFREGAGRKPTGRIRKHYFATEKEHALLKIYLEKLRKAKNR